MKADIHYIKQSLASLSSPILPHQLSIPLPPFALFAALLHLHTSSTCAMVLQCTESYQPKYDEEDN